jgi:quinone-modifying oxidoreductase subunit QmoA
VNASNKKILVIGGGMSGLTAALEAAESGAQVVLVEKTPYLGGRVAQLNKYFPKLCPPTCGLEINFKRIKNNPDITFYTMTDVTQITGQEGDFNVTLNVRPRFVNDKCVACNKCAEVCPIERPNDFNYGLDNNKAAYLPFDMQMERLAAPNGPTAGKILRPSDGAEPKEVAFVQCAGSRDENHLPYCSYICCMASLKQATYLLDADPEAKATVFYIDIRTPGRYEQFFWKVRDRENVELIRGKVAKISQAPGNKVELVAEDTATGNKVRRTFDMVVLAAGMVPSTKTDKLPMAVKYTDEGFIDPTGLPAGVQAVGSLKSPLDVAKSVQDGTSAAIKALQSLVGR